MAIAPRPLRLKVRSSAQMDKGSRLHLAMEFHKHSSVLSCYPNTLPGHKKRVLKTAIPEAEVAFLIKRVKCLLQMTRSI